jgi:hypothetical protein
VRYERALGHFLAYCIVSCRCADVRLTCPEVHDGVVGRIRDYVTLVLLSTSIPLVWGS